MSEELDKLLSTPPQPSTSPFKVPAAWTPRREISADQAVIVTRPTVETPEVDDVLTDAGLDPAQWELLGYRKSEWEVREGEWRTSHRFTLKPRPQGDKVDTLSDLLARVEASPAAAPVQAKYSVGAYVHATGDWQLGKIDGDGWAGTVDRIVAGIDASADRLHLLGAGEAHITFLGDCVEGFNSQGGALAWRTGLTLTEQIRLVRRLMFKHVETFAPLVNRLTVVAVPGNHDEAVRFGKGITRADDSFALEALHAVADACAQNPGAFGHVEFFTPDLDSLTVTTQVAGTVITHLHGHQLRSGKHFEWLDAMAGNRQREGEADLLMAGHKHHLVIEERGPRTFLQVPAMESESTYWKARTGQGGHPGVLTFTTKDGRIHDIEVLR